MKYMIINEKCDDYFFPYVTDKDVDIRKIYITHGKISEIYMKVLRKMNLNFTKFLATWNLDKTYDCIVVFDCSCDYKNIPYIKGNNEDVRLFIWNLADDFIGRLKKSNKNVDFEYVKKHFDHVYSFDKNDCEKYDLEYYPTLFTKELHAENKSCDNDVVFLGSEKGRYSLLKTVYETIHSYGFKQLYHIYKKDAPLIEANEFTVTSRTVSYDDYLGWINDSKAIVDIPQAGQVGFTLRVMESIFLHKKLFTTCKEIKKYRIYNPNNIFVIGDDSDVTAFLTSEYESISEEVLSNYEIMTWLKNMDSNIQVDTDI